MQGGRGYVGFCSRCADEPCSPQRDSKRGSKNSPALRQLGESNEIAHAYLAQKHSAYIRRYFYHHLDPSLLPKTPSNIPEHTLGADAGWGHPGLGAFPSAPFQSLSKCHLMFEQSHQAGGPSLPSGLFPSEGAAEFRFPAGARVGAVGRASGSGWHHHLLGSVPHRERVGTRRLDTQTCCAQAAVVRPPPQPSPEKGRGLHSGSISSSVITRKRLLRVIV